MSYPTVLPRSARVLEEVSYERARQDSKWGEQNHPVAHGAVMKNWPAVDEGFWTEDVDPPRPTDSLTAYMNAMNRAVFSVPSSWRMGGTA